MLDEADALYGLPDDEFTAARDALAKRLRAEKRREDADAVKALRKPSVAAAAINRAVREHGAGDLLAAGDALRDAHEALLSGSGDAAAVREATARERDAVRELTRLALGSGGSASTEEKVRATLHAAAVDPEVRELLEAGRLVRDAEAGVDPSALLGAGAAPARSGAAKAARSGASKEDRSATAKPGRSGAPKVARSATAKPARSAPSKPARSGSGRSRPSDAERRRAKAAERAREEADRAVAAQAEAESAAERARAALAEAEEAARKARAVVEDLEGHERAARRAVKEAEAEAERRRTEARRAVKTAESRA